ncbi:ATP-dependent Lon protease pim1 [Dinochytrium kinnereticum]|nr:ATP-dependent Lon protease pim1 [Dinochytrium kinnereticum]
MSKMDPTTHTNPQSRKQDGLKQAGPTTSTTSLVDEGYGSLPTFNATDGGRSSVGGSKPSLQTRSIGALRNPLRDMPSRESFGHIPIQTMTTFGGTDGGGDRVATIDVDDEDLDVKDVDAVDEEVQMNPLRRGSNAYQPPPKQKLGGSAFNAPPGSYEAGMTLKRWTPMTDLTRAVDPGNDEAWSSGNGGSSIRSSADSSEGADDEDDRYKNRSMASFRSTSSTYSNASPSSSSSSFTASFNSHISADHDRRNVAVHDLPSYGRQSSKSGSVKSDRDRRPKTAPGHMSPTSEPKNAMSSMTSSMAKIGINYSTQLHTLMEETESGPVKQTIKSASKIQPPPPPTSQPQQHHSIMTPLTSLQKSAARWSKLPMLLPNSLKKLGGKRAEERQSASTSASQPPVSQKGKKSLASSSSTELGRASADLTTIAEVPTSLKSSKRSMSAGRILRRSPAPPNSNPLLRRLMSGKNDKGKAPPVSSSAVIPPTSIPMSMATSGKLKGGVAVESKVGSSQTLGSTATLGLEKSGTVWDEEEQGSAKNSSSGGESDVEAAAIAKAKFESRYKVLKQLGSGGHSTVRLATRLSDSTPVVLKFIRNSSVWHWSTNPTTQKKYPLEIHLMRKFAKDHHPNIIQYYEHFEMNGKYIIAMEYLGEDWVDLYDYIEMFGPVKEEITVEIFGQVVDIILYLYRRGYHHNDIKDENILINTKTRTIKLIDFGSATLTDPTKTCELFYGTKKFAAPEAVRGEPYHPEAQEVWALGTLLFVLLFKLDPFTTDEEILTTDIGRRIARYRNASVGGGGGLDISDEAARSLKMMMEKDWARRVRLSDIKDLPIFKKFSVFDGVLV